MVRDRRRRRRSPTGYRAGVGHRRESAARPQARDERRVDRRGRGGARGCRGARRASRWPPSPPASATRRCRCTATSRRRTTSSCSCRRRRPGFRPSTWARSRGGAGGSRRSIARWCSCISRTRGCSTSRSTDRRRPRTVPRGWMPDSQRSTTRRCLTASACRSCSSSPARRAGADRSSRRTRGSRATSTSDDAEITRREDALFRRLITAEAYPALRAAIDDGVFLDDVRSLLVRTGARPRRHRGVPAGGRGGSARHPAAVARRRGCRDRRRQAVPRGAKGRARGREDAPRRPQAGTYRRARRARARPSHATRPDAHRLPQKSHEPHGFTCVAPRL